MCGAAHAPHEHPAPAASLHTSTAPSQAGTPGANGNASRLQRTLQHNDGFVSNKGYKEFDTSKRSTAPSVVLTCMDSRLIELLPKAMNFRTGEAKIIKTAGAILTHPFGGAWRRGWRWWWWRWEAAADDRARLRRRLCPRQRACLTISTLPLRLCSWCRHHAVGADRHL